MSSTLGFALRAFDCNIRVETACHEADDILQRYLFPSIARTDNITATPDIFFCVERRDDQFQLSVNGAQVALEDSAVNLAVAAIKALDDHVVQRLTTLRAVHAGAILFSDRAMLIPGSTHAGKSSLVAELLRRGASYLSDEYALIDEEGHVHPYPRPLLLRNGRPRQVPVLPGDLNASFARGRAAVGWVLSLEYEAANTWNIQSVSQGEAVMILLRNTPHPLQESPSMTDVFLRAVARASCYCGQRGDAVQAVDAILKLVGGVA